MARGAQFLPFQLALYGSRVRLRPRRPRRALSSGLQGLEFFRLRPFQRDAARQAVRRSARQTSWTAIRSTDSRRARLGSPSSPITLRFARSGSSRSSRNRSTNSSRKGRSGNRPRPRHPAPSDRRPSAGRGRAMVSPATYCLLPGNRYSRSRPWSCAGSSAGACLSPGSRSRRLFGVATLRSFDASGPHAGPMLWPGG